MSGTSTHDQTQPAHRVDLYIRVELAIAERSRAGDRAWDLARIEADAIAAIAAAQRPRTPFLTTNLPAAPQGNPTTRRRKMKKIVSNTVSVLPGTTTSTHCGFHASDGTASLLQCISSAAESVFAALVTPDGRCFGDGIEVLVCTRHRALLLSDYGALVNPAAVAVGCGYNRWNPATHRLGGCLADGHRRTVRVPLERPDGRRDGTTVATQVCTSHADVLAGRYGAYQPAGAP